MPYDPTPLQYEAWVPRIESLARSMGVADSDIPEVAGVVMEGLIAARTIERYDPERSPSEAWMVTAIKLRIMTARRRLWRLRREEREVVPRLGAVMQVSEEPLDRTALQEAISRTIEAIDSPKLAEAFLATVEAALAERPLYQAVHRSTLRQLRAHPAVRRLRDYLSS